MTDIILTPSIYDSIVQHAKDTLPNECCGYVTGIKNIAKTVYPMTNMDASPVHFSFDPKEQFYVIKSARHNGEHPLIVYHSHPESPPRLSNEDLRLLKDPNMVYLIISLEQNTPSMKAYRIEGDVITEVLINVKEDTKCQI